MSNGCQDEAKRYQESVKKFTGKSGWLSKRGDDAYCTIGVVVLPGGLG
jgi:hypothetical protein